MDEILDFYYYKEKKKKGDYNMLETRNERVKLLKAGFDGKRIEKEYVTGNNIKIIKSNLLYTGK